MGLDHLADTDIYTECAEDPTHQLCLAINIEDRKGCLSSDMHQFLILDPNNTRTQQAYTKIQLGFYLYVAARYKD